MDLNSQQLLAAEAPPGVLQIVAGPGTGKTKVLVARVAHLLRTVPPQNIVVTTFTKKAANELVERLRAVSDAPVDKLRVGTFHSLCFRLLRQYGARIGLSDLHVADEKDAHQVVAEVLKNMTADELAVVDALPAESTLPYRSKTDGLDPKKLRRAISRLKARGIEANDPLLQNEEQRLVGLVYQQYQRRLLAHCLVDFDDCLLQGLRLLAVQQLLVEHVLVDEFQDTNEVQLRLMYAFARHNNVTVVGDPDQSIYAFRDAQSGNFDKMRHHYTSLGLQCHVVHLVENYRSTTDILALSERVMRQQVGRAQKTLRSQYSSSFPPQHAVLTSSEEEARWIAYHVAHLHRYRDLFSWSDIAILVRSAYQTRAIETELVRQKIPYIMVKGRAFWDRKEVSAMVDYLRCASSDSDRLAWLRLLNMPKRGFGPKAVAELGELCDLLGLLAFHTLERVALGKLPSSFGEKMRASLADFLDVLREARDILDSTENPKKENGTSNFRSIEQMVHITIPEVAIEPENTSDIGENIPSISSDLLERFFTFLYTRSGLQKEFDDADCDLNVSEIKSQLVEFQPQDDEEVEDRLHRPGMAFLRMFLSLLSLFDTDPDTTSSNTPKVAISTIHGAKGLEWPVVFVPGLSEGLLPAMYALEDAESVNEERRCFYVATTRARMLLFMSSYLETEGKWGRKPIDAASRFLKDLSLNKAKDIWGNMSQVYEAAGKHPEDVDFDGLEKQYRMCLRAQVQKDVDTSSFELGFSTGKAQLSRQPKRVGKAPVYIPMRTKLFVPPRPLHSRISGGSTSSAPISSVSSVSSASSISSVSSSISSASSVSSTSSASTAPIRAPNTSLNVSANSYPFKSLERKPIQSIASVPSDTAKSTATKRAPAYIPVRPASKRRLGTR